MSMTMMVPVRPMPALGREGAPSETQPALAGKLRQGRGSGGRGVSAAPAGAGLREPARCEMQEPGRVTGRVGRVEVCPALHRVLITPAKGFGGRTWLSSAKTLLPRHASLSFFPAPHSTAHSAPHPRRSGTPFPDHILPAPLVLWACPALSHSLGPSEAALLAAGASFGKAPFPVFFRS